jgi:hypothetical protein
MNSKWAQYVYTHNYANLHKGEDHTCDDLGFKIGIFGHANNITIIFKTWLVTHSHVHQTLVPL